MLVNKTKTEREDSVNMPKQLTGKVFVSVNILSCQCSLEHCVYPLLPGMSRTCV